MELTMDH